MRFFFLVISLFAFQKIELSYDIHRIFHSEIRTRRTNQSELEELSIYKDMGYALASVL